MKNAKVMVGFSNVVVKVMDNKYRKTRSESGLILPDGKTYKSQETGQIEHDLEQIIAYAEIVAKGNKCEYAEVGMGCYVDTRSLRPIPFKGKEYMQTHELNVICFIVEEEETE